MTEALKWFETMRIAAINRMAYKANFILMMIAPALVFFVIKYYLWTSIYSLEEGMVIKGYDISTMIQYQLWVMFINLLGHGNNGIDMAADIRLGRISNYMIYPFDFWKHCFANFLALQGLQLIAASTLVGMAVWVNLVPEVSLFSLVAGLCFTVYVSVFWFVLQYLLGTMAFWLEETWVLRVICNIIASFLSGAIIPLELFPKVWQEALVYTPFPYLTYVPTKLLMGTYDGDVWFGYGMLSFWLVILTLFTMYVWKRGVRLYSGAGM